MNNIDINNIKSTFNKKFVAFLEKEGCYESFEYRFLKFHYSNESKQEYYKNAVDNPKGVIDYAFHWAHTPEGNDFWMNLQDKWWGYFDANNLQRTNNKTTEF